MTNIIKVILVILLAPIAAVVGMVCLLAHAIGEFINDIYDDDIYWGGKE